MLRAASRTPRPSFLFLRSLPSHRSQRATLKFPWPSCRTTQSQAGPTVLSTNRKPDPFSLLGPQLSQLRLSLLSLLESAHPRLSQISKYYFLHPSKQIRPLIVLLFSLATNGLGRMWAQKHWEATTEGAGGRHDELDVPLSHPGVLNDWNPTLPTRTAQVTRDFSIGIGMLSSHRPPARTYIPSSSSAGRAPPSLCSPPSILPTQTRLAQIVEMMHTASLLHDDVIDESPLRRGSPSAPAAFGRKFSVLGGNFVLGRASAALSRLGDPEATDFIASVLSDLVEGEILQMRGVKAMREGEEGGLDTPGVHLDWCKEAWNIYLQKTYLKTASLMAKGAKAAVTLGGCKEGDVWRDIAYAYGRDLGIAFQLVDDVLDYDSRSATLGKPGGADLQLGLATGPTLYAWEEHSEMGKLIQRKFKKPGDVERALNFVSRSSAVQRTRELAQEYADKAKAVLTQLPESEARAGLEVLVERVITRKS